MRFKNIINNWKCQFAIYKNLKFFSLWNLFSRGIQSDSNAMFQNFFFLAFTRHL